MCFGPQFARVLQSITEGSTSQILVNGQQGRTFELTRAIQQGCPLLPLISLTLSPSLAMQALSNCISHKKLTKRLRGILMPHIHLKYVQASYADDARASNFTSKSS